MSFININYDSKFLLCGRLRTGVHQRLLRQNKKRSNSVDSPASQWNCALTALTMHTPTPTPQPNPGPPTPIPDAPPPLFCSAAVLSYLLSRGALDTSKEPMDLYIYLCTVVRNMYMKKHLFINFRADPLIRFEGALNQGICGAGKGAARNAAFSEE